MEDKTKSKCLGSSSKQSSIVNQTATELLAVPVSPSEEKAIEQAADWRDAGPKSLVNLALKEAADTGGPIPSPTMYRKLLSLSAKAKEVSGAPQDCFGAAEFSRFRLKILTWTHEVRAQRRKQKRLLNRAVDESSDRKIRARLDGEESARLGEKSQRVGMSPEALLRQGLLQALDRQSEMEDLESWMDRWDERTKRLHERSVSNGGPNSWIWERVAEIAEEIDTVVCGFLPC